MLPKHPTAEAVNYTLNQWKELNVYATVGAVPLDNNASEREMKRICLNRKNSLFVGNERGGQTAVILSSLTSTCRRHGVDSHRYLTQLLTNLPGRQSANLSSGCRTDVSSAIPRCSDRAVAHDGRRVSTAHCLRHRLCFLGANPDRSFSRHLNIAEPHNRPIACST